MRARPAAVLLCVGLLLAASAYARPGGGQSYSGSSSGGSSSGSSGSSHGSGGSSSSSSYSSGGSSSSGGTVSSASEIPILFWPLIGIFGLAMLSLAGQGLLAVVEKIGEAQDRLLNWTSPQKPRPPRPSAVDEATTGDRWEVVRRDDPGFSAVLFEDFVQGLYVAVQRARTDPEAMAALAPYVKPRFLQQLAERETPGPVEAVIVGAVRVERVIAFEDLQRAIVEIESNVTYRGSEGPAAEYLAEGWVLERSRTARTRPWKGARTFGCPACGAPAASSAAERCSSCGQVMEARTFDWCVSGYSLIRRKSAPPALTQTAPERGTDQPTVRQADLDEALRRLTSDDPAVTVAALEARVGLIFKALHEGWAAQELRPLRPFVTDALLDHLQYWIEAYKAQGLVNAVEGARITKQELARITRDAQFDAVTLRVFATGYEVTTQESTVVAGSRNVERPYSEYWTIIRGTGVRGAPRIEPTCPACAAPLAINRAGSCDHCGAHVTSGEFDWVLSRIEQDDAYTG